MKQVFAVTTGGSTLDVLGVFEDEELAKAALADWRTQMQVYDDGWEIQPLVLWDRLPRRWLQYTASARVDPEGQLVARRMEQKVVYEWHLSEPTTASVDLIPQQDGSVRILVHGTDEADVMTLADEGIARAQRELQSKREERRAQLEVPLDERIALFKDSIRNLERPPSANENFPEYQRHMKEWNQYSHLVIEAAHRFGIPSEQVTELAGV
jgi:hypothetical protein